MKITVKPRVQKDKWSLYWKTSMMTKTEMLDEFVIDCPDPAAMTATQLKAKVVHLFRCEAGDDFNPIMLSVRRAYFGPRWNTISLFVAITARVSEGISRRNR